MRSLYTLTLLALLPQLTQAQDYQRFSLSAKAGRFATYHSMEPPTIFVADAPGATVVTPNDEFDATGFSFGMDGRYSFEEKFTVSLSGLYASAESVFFDEHTITGDDLSTIRLPGGASYRSYKLEAGFHRRYFRGVNWLEVQLGVYIGPNLTEITTAEYIEVEVAPRRRVRYLDYREAEQTHLGMGLGLSTRISFFVAQRVGLIIDGRTGIFGAGEVAGAGYSLQGGVGWVFGGGTKGKLNQ